MNIYRKGKSYILTFPFFIYTEVKSLGIQKIKLSNSKSLRIYPLYRQSNANSVFMPHVEISKTPFIKKPSRQSIVYKLPKTVAIPRLDRDKDGKFQNFLAWSENFDTIFSPFPYDSLRIDAYGQFHEREISRLTHKLLDQIRWRTKQWWINRTSADLFGNLRGSFDVDKDGYPIKDSYGHATATTVMGIEKGLNKEIWTESIQSLTIDSEPTFHEVLFLDALFYRFSKNLRLSIFHLAITCEQALDYYAFMKWQNLNKSKKYKKTRVFKGDDLTKHIDTQALDFFGSSYKIDNSKNYELIEILWKGRNNIAHGGNLNIYHNGELIEINDDMVKLISSAVEDFMEWIKKH